MKFAIALALAAGVVAAPLAALDPPAPRISLKPATEPASMPHRPPVAAATTAATDREPVPPEGWLVAAVVVEPDGSVSSCKIDRAEGGVRNADFCKDTTAFQPILDEYGDPVRQRVRIMARVVREALP